MLSRSIPENIENQRWGERIARFNAHRNSFITVQRHFAIRSFNFSWIFMMISNFLYRLRRVNGAMFYLYYEN